MSFLPEIFNFLKNPKNKIEEILEKDFEKKTLLFATAYGITLWSQMLKSAGAGDTLGTLGLFIGILITGSLIGLAIFYFFSFILSKVLEVFKIEFDVKSCQKIYIWCLSPYVISALLTLIEFAVGGSKIYTKEFLSGTVNGGTISVFISMVFFIKTFISIFFIVTFTKILSYTLNIKWWKTLTILFISAMISTLPIFLLKI